MDYKLRLCQGCRGLMEISLPEEELNPYLVELGFKRSDKYWHGKCFDKMARDNGWLWTEEEVINDE